MNEFVVANILTLTVNIYTVITEKNKSFVFDKNNIVIILSFFNNHKMSFYFKGVNYF